jgi:hypothetical protein
VIDDPAGLASIAGIAAVGRSLPAAGAAQNDAKKVAEPLTWINSSFLTIPGHAMSVNAKRRQGRATRR